MTLIASTSCVTIAAAASADNQLFLTNQNEGLHLSLPPNAVALSHVTRSASSCSSPRGGTPHSLGKLWPWFSSAARWPLSGVKLEPSALFTSARRKQLYGKPTYYPIYCTNQTSPLEPSSSELISVSASNQLQAAPTFTTCSLFKRSWLCEIWWRSSGSQSVNWLSLHILSLSDIKHASPKFPFLQGDESETLKQTMFCYKLSCDITDED